MGEREDERKRKKRRKEHDDLIATKLKREMR